MKSVSIGQMMMSHRNFLMMHLLLVSFIHLQVTHGISLGFMSYAASRGWRSCVLNRRGHSGMPLRVIPNFNIIGHIDDSVVMVNYIRDIYKNNFIALAGISAGSGQLVSYIGREGANAKINAAASLCPAWDLSESFSRLQKSNPYLDWFITRGVQNYFLRPSRNQTALSTMKDVVNKAWKATSIVDFMNAAAPLAGSNDLENYFKVNNPMNYILGNAVPCLVLNALDDFLCVKENIQVDLKDKVNNFVLLVTDEGGHIAYNESIHAGNYMWRVTLDFFEAVKLEYHK